mmetsp:Transcript_24842/g.64683  ORF Transcript_24842/g.64683 Transcript_24842/m.64683 type:complete len:729 (+) Transcript_24842:88-2274(+)
MSENPKKTKSGGGADSLELWSQDPPPLVDDNTGLVVCRTATAWSAVGSPAQGEADDQRGLANSHGGEGAASEANGHHGSGNARRGVSPSGKAWESAGDGMLRSQGGADGHGVTTHRAAAGAAAAWGEGSGSSKSGTVATTTASTFDKNARPFEPRSFRQPAAVPKAGGEQHADAAAVSPPQVDGAANGAAAADANAAGGEAATAEAAAAPQYVYGDAAGAVPFAAFRPYAMVGPTSPFLIPSNPGQFGFPPHAFPAGQFGGARGGFFVGDARAYGVPGGRRGKHGQHGSKGGDGRRNGGRRNGGGGGVGREGAMAAAFIPAELAIPDGLGFYPFAALRADTKSRKKGRGAASGQKSRRQRQARNATRSQLLEELHKSESTSTLQLSDLKDHVIEFATDQYGSRFIQNQLDTADDEAKAAVFDEVLPAMILLITDVFGNYVIQKFFQHGDDAQRRALLDGIKGQVIPLSLQMYGCRVLQKALETMTAEQQRELIDEIRPRVLACVRDKNGNHVVQKCIECVDTETRQPIVDAFEGEAMTLAKHPYGCRVVQRILEHCPPAQMHGVQVQLLQHADELLQDQYGNYVAQHMLMNGAPESVARIVDGVRGNLLTLSQHKFASNVVEKCVLQASPELRSEMIKEVCMQTTNVGVPALDTPGSTRFLKATALDVMIRDPFANYVIQRMLDVASAAEREKLTELISPQLQDLRAFPYGKHIVAKIEKLQSDVQKS